MVNDERNPYRSPVEDPGSTASGRDVINQAATGFVAMILGLIGLVITLLGLLVLANFWVTSYRTHWVMFGIFAGVVIVGAGAWMLWLSVLLLRKLLTNR